LLIERFMLCWVEQYCMAHVYAWSEELKKQVEVRHLGIHVLVYCWTEILLLSIGTDTIPTLFSRCSLLISCNHKQDRT